VNRALAAVRAELHLLEALGHRLLVSGRRIVAVLAVRASEYCQFAHLVFLSSFAGGSSPPAGRPTTFGRTERTGIPQKSGPDYLTTFETVPAPTVRPPSRIAKRIFSSRATGAMSLTEISTLSPGMTISTPSGS